jgi:hypothetical protein
MLLAAAHRPRAEGLDETAGLELDVNDIDTIKGRAKR